MRASLAAMDVVLDSRNVALGNNPCTPYDYCVKFFVGLDADIVHWEQVRVDANNCCCWLMLMS